MKASEYVAVIKKLIKEHGDLEVCNNDVRRCRRVAPTPERSFILISTGKCTKPKFWEEGVHPENWKGNPIIQV